MELGSLVPWRDKFRAPANREDIYDPFAMFRRAVDHMFDDFLGAAGGLHGYGSGGQSHQRSTSRIRRRSSSLRQNCPVSTRRTSR